MWENAGNNVSGTNMRQMGMSKVFTNQRMHFIFRGLIGLKPLNSENIPHAQMKPHESTIVYKEQQDQYIMALRATSIDKSIVFDTFVKTNVILIINCQFCLSFSSFFILHFSFKFHFSFQLRFSVVTVFDWVDM